MKKHVTFVICTNKQFYVSGLQYFSQKYFSGFQFNFLTMIQSIVDVMFITAETVFLESKAKAIGSFA